MQEYIATKRIFKEFFFRQSRISIADITYGGRVIVLEEPARFLLGMVETHASLELIQYLLQLFSLWVVFHLLLLIAVEIVYIFLYESFECPEYTTFFNNFVFFTFSIVDFAFEWPSLSLTGFLRFRIFLLSVIFWNHILHYIIIIILTFLAFFVIYLNIFGLCFAELILALLHQEIFNPF